MSEERFNAVETKLDSLAAGQDALAAGQETLARDLRSEMRSMGDDLGRRITSVDTRLSKQIDALDTRLSGQIADLGNEMRVLHEDTIANIKALAPDFAPIRREFEEADAKLREDIDQRLAPLEAFARRRRSE